MSRAGIVDDSNGVVADKQPVPGVQLGLETGDSELVRQSVWQFPCERREFW